MSNILVKDVISRKDKGEIYAIDENNSLYEAIDIFASHEFQSAVVINSMGKLAGIISERDIIRAIRDNSEEALKMKVKDMMSIDMVVCKMEDTLEVALQTMASNNLRHLPVVSESEKLVCFVTMVYIVDKLIAHYEDV